MNTLSHLGETFSSLSVSKVLLAIAIIIILVYWIYNFVILYHLTRFGVGAQPKKIAAVFALGSILLFCITVVLFLTIDFGAVQNSSDLLINTANQNISNFNPNTF